MAAFANRQTRIKLLCDRAEREELDREELASKGLSSHEIDAVIQNKRLEKFRTTNKTAPWQETGQVVKILNTTNIGLADTHKVKTSTQDMMGPVQKKYDKYRTLKKGEKEEALAAQKACENDVDPQMAMTATSELMRKSQKKFTQKEQDKLVKDQNFRDHLFEMYKGMDSLNKMPKESHYLNQYVFDNAMQELTDNTHFDHHLLKNDLNRYNEAYVKYKATMRK